MSENGARDAGENKRSALRPRGAARAKRKGLGKRRRAFSILAPTIFVVVMAIGALLFVRGAMRYDFDGPASQFYAGGEFKIPPDAVMQRADGASTILYDTVRRDAVNLPIYYAEERTLVLPCDMVYYDPRGNVGAKMDYFTELRYDGSGGVTAARGGAARALDAGFLYDGEDTFVFLEPMRVRFNGYEIELSAMSYAEAVYDGSVTLYDRESGEFTMEAPKGSAVCESAGGDYTVSLLSDYFEKADGSRLLLFTKPELLDSYFK
jgi:hypothetical protein